jgi:hypothetical protein
VGDTQEQIRDELGPPNTRERGRYWFSNQPDFCGTVERGEHGQMQPIAVFGPVPQRIQPGAPYEAWTYRNVQGTTWVLYFAAPSSVVDQSNAQPGPMQLVEYTGFPDGAVF